MLLLAAAIVSTLLQGAPASRPAAVTHGPFAGHVDERSARIWARAPAAGAVEFEIWPVDAPAQRRRLVAQAHAENDLCVTVAADGLAPDTDYAVLAARPGAGAAPGAGTTIARFRTAPSPPARARVTLAFGSCAYEDGGSGAVFARMATLAPHGVVLLGDTPYIDRTDLEWQRERWQAFLAFPPLRELMRGRASWATWDDHDFGRNDTDGRLEGKENARKAFVEHHALASYGENDRGIYTSFRYGPIEVFLLDTRWFAGTQPARADPTRRTLLGDAQWDWLRRGLRASTAPFKVLACGMVWNDAVRPGKTDCWGRYPHEWNALLDLLAELRTTGVVLVGGDIHWSRVLRHRTRDRVGQDLVELVTSPIHDGLIPANAVPDARVVWDRGEKHTFLLLIADTRGARPALTARFQNAAGDVLFEIDPLGR